MEEKRHISHKSAALEPLEFRLYKTLFMLEKESGFENKRILLNLQISGGQDSMCLLQAFFKVFELRAGKFKNTYILVVQHFDHQQRGRESQEDKFFVMNACEKIGVPIYIESFYEQKTGNFQNQARRWRKEKAHALCEELKEKLKTNACFIVTAHHARDHVETVLFHLLRGTGTSGLKGLSLLDESRLFLKPFFSETYENIVHYAQKKEIQFREDSSNALQDYTRNYIRHNILPHFQKIQPQYENSFLKMSSLVAQNENVSGQQEFRITSCTGTSEIFNYLKQHKKTIGLSKNSVLNILHEAKLILKTKEKILEKKLPLKGEDFITLTKERDYVLIK